MAVRLIVPALALSVIVIPPLAAVSRSSVPVTDDAPRLTELASLMKADPNVDSVKVPALVCSSVPDCPRSPEPDERFTSLAVNVKRPARVIVPVPSADKVIVLAFRLLAIVSEPSEPAVVATDKVLPALMLSKVRLPSWETKIEPVVEATKLVTSTNRGVPVAPRSPPLDVIVRSVAVRVKSPARVIAPEPLAVRLMVAADESPVKVIAPLVAVSRSRVPVTDDAPRLTELASLMKAEPVVERVNVSALVCNSVPD